MMGRRRHPKFVECATGRLVPVVALFLASVVGVSAGSIGPAAATPVENAAPEAASHASCTSSLIGGSVYFVCDLLSTGTSVDLASLPGVTPGADTPIWIQTWGGKGADLSFLGKTSKGGAAGFAQMITTLSDYETRHGSTKLYYYLGAGGDGVEAAAGPGGAATLVTAVDPATTTLDTSTNVVAMAGGGGGSVLYCEPTPSFCSGGHPRQGTVSGGDAGVAMSNVGGTITAAQPGGTRWGGGAGGDGKGGTYPPTHGGQNGKNGKGGIGGQGGSYDGNPTLWSNAPDLSSVLGTAGAGGNAPCMSYEQRAVCISGSGGGGWGGGASGSNGDAGQYDPSGGGGGGTFVAPSSATDATAPTTPPTPPGGGNGAVTITVAVDLDFEATFCKEATLAGTEGFRCVVPFNWQFEIPEAYTGQDWLVTLQAVGGRGGNGGAGGRAQTTRATTGLAGETLYAWVGAQGAEAVDHGGGGGGATALGTSSNPWEGAGGAVLSSDLLLVAGGGGGGVALNACSTQGGHGGGAGGVAVTEAGVAYGNGHSAGTGGGSGANHTNGAWNGGWDGSGNGDPGTGGQSYLMFEGGLGGDQPSGRAATVTSIAAPDTPTDRNGTPATPAGDGGHGFCHGGGGGAGAGGAGGGSGGSGSDDDVQQGGGGGGGGSQAAASDVAANLLPSWAGQWLTLQDETSGQVSLFFYKASQGPPPVPVDGATIDETQPTLGLETGHSGSFAYRVTDETAGKTYLASPSTQNALWTVPDGGSLTPGHTYSWEIVDGGGNLVQAARTLTVDPSTEPVFPGVRMEMRSMNHYADSNSPAYLQPEPGQKVPGLSSSDSAGCAGGDHPGCYNYKGSAGNPDDYSDYFTTATAAQGTTNPGAINADWDVFDPFGLGLRELFTLHITGTLTPPVSGEYTFAVNAFGGARYTLTDEDGSTVGGDPMIDSWGQVSNCSSGFQTSLEEDEWDDLAKAVAAIGCVNSHGTTVAPHAVTLTAGKFYTFVMDGFMSWQPGPFQLLYSSDVFASDLSPVPGGWFTTTQPALGAPPMCGGRPATIVGSDGFDWLVGTPGDDVIVAGAGNDWIFGGGGRDVVCAGDGRDVVFGQAGEDEIYGGPGHDWIWGGSGEDRIRGEDGHDRISGGSGRDLLAGGFGSDRLYGGGGRDIIFGVDYEHWLADPAALRDRDRAVGGRGFDRCLLIEPRRGSSCESDQL